MTDPVVVGDLRVSVGYALKQAATSLRTAMDEVLRPLDLTVAQYSCLEVLGQRPGLSNSELSRAVFVTRQAMNQIVGGLQDRGLLARPAEAPRGRARPAELSAEGRRVLRRATRVVADVEQRMLASFDEPGRRRLLADLLTCRDAVGDPPGPGVAAP